VIGESIVAIGIGFTGIALDLSSIVLALLGLGVAYYFWWAYFAGDEERSARALAAIVDPRRKAQMALWAWAYAHFPMIFGIVLFSAGIKKAIPAAFDPLKWNTAAALAVGAALFLVGHAAFLALLRLWRGVPHRLVAAVLVVLTIFIGQLDATAQVVTILAILAGALIIEDLPQVLRSRSTNVHSFGR
jgi:low temperature requirement protein LtrA